MKLKRIISIIVAGLFIVSILVNMSACGIQPSNIGENDNDRMSTDRVLLGLKEGNMEKVVLDEKDSTKIKSLLNQENWEDETAECANNIEIILEDNWLVYYHTDCGTFNDYTNKRHLSLGESEKEEMYEIISKYIEIRDFD